MKLEHLKIIIVLFAAFMLFSCETSDDNIENSLIDLTEINATATSGTWLVARFEEDGVDQTSNFSGYSFTFNTDGILNVTNEDLLITGSWSITSDSSSSDDDSSNDYDFNIFFTSPSNFEELSEDWEIVSYNDTRIELKHLSGGDASIDYLSFEKQ